MEQVEGFSAPEPEDPLVQHLSHYMNLDGRVCTVCRVQGVSHGSFPCGCNDLCIECYSADNSATHHCPSCLKEVWPRAVAWAWTWSSRVPR